MTDRELIELAAKAAGIDGKWGKERYIERHEGFIPTGWLRAWNPLTDDRDALRLAVKLANTNDSFHSIVWNWTHRAVRVFADASEGYGEDEYSATRRAIVRAAAKIGNEMK